MIRAGAKKPNKTKLPAEPEAPARPEITHKEEMDAIDILSREKELLGSYVSGHPLNEVTATAPDTIQDIKERGDQGDWVELLAVPSMIKEITTKSKKKMAYIVLEDMTGTINAVVLPHIYPKVSDVVQQNTAARYMATLEITEMDTDDGMVHKITKLVVQRANRIVIPKREAILEEISVVVPVHEGLVTAQRYRDTKDDLTIKLKTSDDNHISFKLPRK